MGQPRNSGSGGPSPTRAESPSKDEPRRHPLYLVLLALATLGTVPVLFVGREPVSWLGLPIWLWSSIGFTVALSLLTAWGLLNLWKDEDSD